MLRKAIHGRYVQYKHRTYTLGDQSRSLTQGNTPKSPQQFDHDALFKISLSAIAKLSRGRSRFECNESLLEADVEEAAAC